MGSGCQFRLWQARICKAGYGFSELARILLVSFKNASLLKAAEPIWLAVVLECNPISFQINRHTNELCVVLDKNLTADCHPWVYLLIKLCAICFPISKMILGSVRWHKSAMIKTLKALVLFRFSLGLWSSQLALFSNLSNAVPKLFTVACKSVCVCVCLSPYMYKKYMNLARCIRVAIKFVGIISQVIYIWMGTSQILCLFLLQTAV